MFTPKPFPISWQNYWRFMSVFIVGIAIIYGVALVLDFVSGEWRPTVPAWHWMLGNVIALVLTEIGMAMGGWVTVTDGIVRNRRQAFIFVVGYAILFGVLSQEEWVSSINASVGQLSNWYPWLWYLGWLTSMKPMNQRGEESPVGKM